MTRNVSAIANSQLNPEDAIVGYNGGRLGLYSSTELAFESWNGPYIEVATQKVLITPPIICDVTTSKLLNLDGSNSALGPSANTLYYAYVSSGGVLQLSDNGPIYNYQQVGLYLSDVGSGLRWRFVGWVRTGAGPSVEDSPTRRCIVNLDNRIPRTLFYCPNYADNNAQTTYNVTSATWAPLGAADAILTIAGSRLGAVSAALVVTASNVGAGGAQFALRAEQQTFPNTTRRGFALAAAANQTGTATIAETYDSEDVVSITPEFVSAAATTVVADNARNGAANDPPMTYVSGWVLG